MPPYVAAFPKGSRARVAALPVLAEFKRAWKFHHPLQSEQLEYAGRIGTIGAVSYYHGGDALYSFDEWPGIWHECCVVEATT